MKKNLAVRQMTQTDILKQLTNVVSTNGFKVVTRGVIGFPFSATDLRWMSHAPTSITLCVNPSMSKAHQSHVILSETNLKTLLENKLLTIAVGYQKYTLGIIGQKLTCQHKASGQVEWTAPLTPLLENFLQASPTQASI